MSEKSIIQSKVHPVWNVSPLGPYVTATLKGISQVLLIENAITGLFVLIAIMIASVPLGLVTLASAIIGTSVAWICGAEDGMIKRGLFGYNSVLTGLALFLFLGGDNRWIFTLLGAAVATLVTASIMNALRNFNVPILTLPFNLLTWFVLLSSFGFESIQLSPDLVQQDLSHWTLQRDGDVEIMGWIMGIGQIYFNDNMWSAILILIGICCAGWRFGLYTVIGAVLSWLTAYALGAAIPTLNQGLYGYNAILAILAVSIVFNEQRRYSAITGMIAAILAVIVTASISDWLIPYGLPALTMPFVIVTWLIMSMRKVLVKL